MIVLLGKFQFLSCVFMLFFLLGMLSTYFSDREDSCIMTYMFEYPQFVRIPVAENVIYPQYGLYAYSEGRLTEKARKMWFDGVPVLFLPGNSGSHKQARSLASVAIQKAMNKGYEYHFDYYTVSFNEELSGLYGGVLQQQTQFAAACISKILSLYKTNKYRKSVPSSVILIGHSMGGLIAKRLLAFPDTINSTSIAITLATPLESPVINTDIAMDNYYKLVDLEWEYFIRNDREIREKKILISFGGGVRDKLVPSGLTSSEDSFVNALTTAVPGVWVSPDHVSIAWCKQIVMAINRYLFDVVDPATEQISQNKQLLRSKALMYFQANRSMTLSPDIRRATKPMLADAFWYEDNRRIYQVTRPDIQKTTYLMIRLVSFPQNRFAAVESVNVDDKDWIFGCSAKYTHNSYRYCKEATSLTELSRWTGAATPQAGKRKLATINLHQIMKDQPEWTHVVVKVSPTRKPVTLNVDINDLSSRQVSISRPIPEVFREPTIIVHETEPNSLYYEVVIPGLKALYEAYYLHVVPGRSCELIQYHVSAELHVPWAENHEYYHYFTQEKRSPMKLALFRSKPNASSDEHAKVTLLLDPRCTFTIGISTTLNTYFSQFSRHYATLLIPYVAAVLILVNRVCISHIKESGTCISTHSALKSPALRLYHVMVIERIGVMLLTSVPLIAYLFETASNNNQELLQFMRSLLPVPCTLIAVGVVTVMAAAVVFFMVCSSQIAHRLLFRIMWRGGPGLAEKVASGLQKVPAVVSASLVCVAQLSCGAAAMAAGAAFYSFMISKMYEEYLEDYCYKLLARVAAQIWQYVSPKKRKRPDSDDSAALLGKPSEADQNTQGSIEYKTGEGDTDIDRGIDQNNEPSENQIGVDDTDKTKEVENSIEAEIDEKLSNLNFHMMMFIMWLLVTVVNIPALLIWARNFKHSKVLQPDTSYHTGLALSVCSTFIWQMEGPKKNLKNYEHVSMILFVVADFILILGPMTLAVVNYGVTFAVVVITLHQVCERENNIENKEHEGDAISESGGVSEDKSVPSEKTSDNESSDGKPSEESQPNASGSEQNVKDVSEHSEDGERIRTKLDFIESDFGAI